ncbi:MAG: response regulator transcription factor [Treponema sp.]|jgi:DNA-binding response OmpR family regulator|nr:response regulator transcription factor [Treponema sp.]
MTGKPVVLAIDDEEKILELIRSYLEKSGYQGLCAKTGREGLRLFEESMASRYPVSLILLDLMLPDLAGEELCRKVRAVSEVPIIMITARVDEESIIRGLNIGADDYVTKPFSPRQLMARIAAALRRTNSSGKGMSGGFLVYRDLAADTEKRLISRDGQEIALTRDEYKIMTLLMSRPSKIFTRDEIIGNIKGDDYDGFDRSIDTHIKNIRQKIGDDPKSPRYIVTVYGMGYRLAGE